MNSFEEARERIKDWCQQLGLDYEAHYKEVLPNFDHAQRAVI